MVANLQDLLAQYEREHDFSGVALIRRSVDTLFAYACGCAHKGYSIANTLNTRFDTASITKLYTAVGIVLLESEGRITFCDRIADILDLSGTSIPRDVQIRHLLTHTSGIADDAEEENGEDYSALFLSQPSYSFRENRDFLKNFVHKPPNFQPGTAVRYNNCAFILLGLALERVTGIPYRDYIQRNVFDRLNLAHTGFFAKEDTASNIAEGYSRCQTTGAWKKNIYSFPPIGTADSGAYTTAGDLDLFLRAVLASPTLSKMMQPQTDQFRTRRDGGRTHYGFGFEIVQKDGRAQSIYKEGCNAGVCNMTAYLPEKDVTFTLLANQDCDVWALHREACALL